MVGWDTPLTDADAEDPMQSTNPFVVALMWYFLGMLNPLRPQGFSKAQTSSLSGVWDKPLPRAIDEIDSNWEILVGKFTTFCDSESGKQIFANKAFDRVSLTILGALTAATMKAWSGKVLRAGTSHPNLVTTMSAITLVQEQAQDLLKHLFTQSSAGSEVFSPVWRDAFIEQASSSLQKEIAELWDADQATDNTIASLGSFAGTARGSTRQSTTVGGSSAGPQAGQAGSSTGSQNRSAMSSAADSKALMGQFAGMLERLDSVKDTHQE